MSKNNLEERLISFAVLVLDLVTTMKKSFAGNHLSEQLTRSSTSAALNYGEAQSGESRKDFIHKLKVVLKELRESQVSLMIVYRANLHPDEEQIQFAIKESNELVSIFVASVATATKNQVSEKSKTSNRTS